MGLLDRLGFNATRSTDGTMYYSQIGNQRAELDGYTTYTAALRSPILFGLIDKIAKFVAQADFYIEGDDENKSNDPLIALLNSPNGFQSKEDFLKEFTFNYISSGYDFIATVGSVGFEHDVTRVDSIYNLNPLYIDYNSVNFKTKLLTRGDIKDSNLLKFRYNVQQGSSGQASSYEDFDYKDVMGFFDVANGLTKDFLLSSPSRLDPVLQAAVNVIKAFEAQNIVIKSNGREMFFNQAMANTLPGVAKNFDQKDIDKIQRANANYGMEHGKNRAMFLNKETGHKSLHIDAKEIGIQEVLNTSAAAIATALNVPKDLIPVFDNTTYTNKKESEIELIQGTVEPILSDLCRTISTFFKYDGKPLRYSVDHLAPMQHIELIKTDKVLKLSTAYKNFIGAGMPTEETRALFEDLGINMMENE
jgi:phage portal protein BeeE